MATTDVDFQELMRQWRAVMALRRPRWHAVDLTFTQLRALSAVGRRQPLRVSDLAEELGAGLAATSALVDRMSRHGLLARRADAEDRRIVLLELTPRARRMLDRLEQGSSEHFTRLIERMTPVEREALATTLRAFIRLNAEEVLEKREHGLVAVRRGA
ncbi:MAG TPA: MarR family transcriptional regulator [Candidatus Limnocylindria bacterium]